MRSVDWASWARQGTRRNTAAHQCLLRGDVLALHHSAAGSYWAAVDEDVLDAGGSRERLREQCFSLRDARSAWRHAAVTVLARPTARLRVRDARATVVGRGLGAFANAAACKLLPVRSCLASHSNETRAL